ncbi:MAG: hypothetical protein S4CHLAM37_09710 [Chlamydiia bacterium]|nr:hypothetical protein [Chlamydiia bacterium]
MKEIDWYIFKDFLDCADEEKKSKLIQHLADEEKEEVLSTPQLPLHPSKGLPNFSERLASIHYSWLTPLLEKMYDEDRYLFISVLSEKQQEKLYKYFDLTKDVDTLSDIGKEYISSKLYHYFVKKHQNIIPIECLPDDPLNDLLDLTRNELLHLVDHLSMHDLSIEMKTMIDASHFMKIESLLTFEQKQYLRKLGKSIEPIAFKPIGLNHWDGDEKLLKKILHQRGLNRLSKALSASHISLLWHLSHKLDMGRASIVKTLFKELKNKKAQQILVSQVCELIESA